MSCAKSTGWGFGSAATAAVATIPRTKSAAASRTMRDGLGTRFMEYPGGSRRARAAWLHAIMGLPAAARQLRGGGRGKEGWRTDEKGRRKGDPARNTKREDEKEMQEGPMIDGEFVHPYQAFRPSFSSSS